MAKILSKSGQSAKKIASMYKPSTWREKGWIWRISLIVGTVIFINLALMFYWSSEPNYTTIDNIISKYSSEKSTTVKAVEKKPIKPTESAAKTNTDNTASYTDTEDTTTANNTKIEEVKISEPVAVKSENNSINTNSGDYKTGTALTSASIYILDSLQDKPGGYISNDKLPPGLFLDNIPEWEYGALRNMRDLSKIYRNYFSTSGSQTEQDKDLIKVENELSIDSESWAFPSSEGAYDNASKALKRYLVRITDEDNYNAQFYARADNLRRYLRVVSTNLGSLSQRLAASVGVKQENTALANDKNAAQSTKSPKILSKKTPWLKVDNNFYEARGYAWALLHQLEAIEIDFKKVLEDKNATAYVKQLIREIKATQKTVWSPIILNGDGFSIVTNHSLIMASYLSRANSIIIDLTNLLENG